MLYIEFVVRAAEPRSPSRAPASNACSSEYGSVDAQVDGSPSDGQVNRSVPDPLLDVSVECQDAGLGVLLLRVDAGAGAAQATGRATALTPRT